MIILGVVGIIGRFTTSKGHPKDAPACTLTPIDPKAFHR